MWKRRLRSLTPHLLLTGGLTLSACGGGSTPDPTADKLDSVMIFGAKAIPLGNTQKLQISEDHLSGSGEIIFDQPLPGMNSSSAFLLGLKIEEGGFVEIHAYCSSRLEGGIRLRIELNNQNWNFVLSREEVEIPLRNLEVLVDPSSGELDLGLEIHHQETPAHILLWNPLANDTFILDTLDVGSPGNGSGRFWGIRFHQAKILRAERTNIRYAHDE